MCGIVFFCSDQLSLDTELSNGLLLTRHRGPDYSGIFSSKVGNYYVGLGHNRLSILDPSPLGNQPMHSESGVSLIFNGEIYNHLPLRESLEKQGVKFKSSSDTEVILNLYEEYGISCFSMIRGMYTIAILDPGLQKLVVVRDIVGIKPLYIAYTDYGLVASSEIKGISTFPGIDWSLDKTDVFEFFNNGFLYEPRTGYRGVQKLLPGHCLSFDLMSGSYELNPYNKIESWGNDESDSIGDLINKSVGEQLYSDVPLGVFFSGGADSCLLAVNTKESPLLFARYGSDPSADIDKKYSEKIAKYLDKTLMIECMDDSDAKADALLEQVSFVAKNTEELVSDYTFWSTYRLSQVARNNGFTVMLSGMGGDEAFAGYPRYKVLKAHKLLQLLRPVLSAMLKFKLFPEGLNKKFERLVSYASESDFCLAYSKLLGYFTDKELNQLFKTADSKELKKQYSARLDAVMISYEGDLSDKVKVAQHLDRFGFLAHNLTVSDKASMIASIELRVPLLDERIVNRGLALDSSSLVDRKSAKKPLKKLLKSTLPKELVERPKTGFNPPIDILIMSIGKERIQRRLATLEELFDRGLMAELLDKHFNKVNNNAYKLWQLLYFSYWLEHSLSFSKSDKD